MSALPFVIDVDQQADMVELRAYAKSNLTVAQLVSN